MDIVRIVTVKELSWSDQNTGSALCCQELGSCRVKLFAWAYNQRQLWKRRYPKHPGPITDFVSPHC
ncbi:MAG: hypothetical protein AVDCRST_MAG93-6759 [uncultured Chloroflexia bacterium]|uniref:Uncharacterized protein n=1 Tax=uncultured Chloroflexia bacterium TaxID=1672391 RepID=A0A6J4LVT9_9CHLR|nr:MAG: hypothetical protein AVDCRST_MAG93-6759 [uncultured Chloroflexia bacterium]